jgi:hypothetical protein
MANAGVALDLVAQLPTSPGTQIPAGWDCFGTYDANGTITTHCYWFDDVLPPVQDWGGNYGGGGENPGNYGSPGGGGSSLANPPSGGNPIDQFLPGRVKAGTQVTGLRKIGQFDDWTCNNANLCAPDVVTVDRLEINAVTQSGAQISFTVVDVTLHRKPYSSRDMRDRVVADYSFQGTDMRIQSSVPRGIRLIYINNVPISSTLRLQLQNWQGGMGQIGQQPIYFNKALGYAPPGEENVIFVPLTGRNRVEIP